MTARDRTPIVHAPGVLRIPLTRGLFALVDEADASLVAPHRWHAIVGKHTHYAARTTGERCLLMHREVVLAQNGQMVDHRDRNGLNNQRRNLRFATNAQNLANSVMRVDNTSGYRGVHWEKNEHYWYAKTVVDGKQVYIARHFDTPEDAARAYDAFVLRARGEFAVLNFPHG